MILYIDTGLEPTIGAKAHAGVKGKATVIAVVIEEGIKVKVLEHIVAFEIAKVKRHVDIGKL